MRCDSTETKHYAKNDGVDVGTLFAVSCDQGGYYEPPIGIEQ